MATNKFNQEILLKGFKQIQSQHPDWAIEEAQGIFLDPFEEEQDLDLEILCINLFDDPDEFNVYWLILLCGPDSKNYADKIYEADQTLEVNIVDLNGTRNGMELYNILVIAG